MRVAEVLATELADSGLDTIFGVVGEGNLVLATYLHSHTTVQYVAARREDGAVAMAEGYALASGRLGVATVTHGPGLTNAVTALTEAVRARTPMLLLAGAVGLTDRTNRQHLDQARVGEVIGARVVDVTSPLHAAADLRRAMTLATSQRIPVLVNLPVDVQRAETEPIEDPWQSPSLVRPTPDSQAVAHAAQALVASQRPIILAGRGAVLADARAELEHLADSLGALVCTTLFANGFFVGNPYNIGICGGFATGLAERLVQNADCAVVFGASLNRWTTGNGQLFRGTVIHCDSDPAALGRWHATDYPLVADAAIGAAALAEALPEPPSMGPAGWGYRGPQIRAEIANYDISDEFHDASGPEGIDIHRACVVLDHYLPSPRQIVVDVGHFMSVPSKYVQVSDPRGYISPSSFGAIGLSLATAVGAAAARPDLLTVCFVGDGGLMMGLPELDSARRRRLSLLVVVMNDDAYGAEVHLCRHYGIPDDLAWFSPVNFVTTAVGLGLRASTATTVEELENAVGELVCADGPALLELRVNVRVVTKYYQEAIRVGGHHR